MLTEVEGAVIESVGKVPPCHQSLHWLVQHQIQASCQPINGGADAGRGESFTNRLTGEGQTDTDGTACSLNRFIIYKIKKKLLCDCLHQHGEESHGFRRKMDNEVLGKL